MFRQNELDQPRFFSTEHHIELSRENKQEQYVPVGIVIEGYTVTSFYDKEVEFQWINKFESQARPQKLGGAWNFFLCQGLKEPWSLNFESGKG
ncbi:hypothetical protein BABA_16022 [Neobacillus bataviensis LMG 21833]|uniref:Uncharacterized protein n=1 Tax=Neobacillus bataviensis LMG 21833 TaxID=1117379 RepID=K6D1L9_9BACI|nr:hypothetical protein [Neobacillus bataviensis]EKN66387.1 hypothetical protein BABA_16022 [Neobacillus bataviensis LMG 21833]